MKKQKIIIKPNVERNYSKIEILVASPKQIRFWARRFLPNGQTAGEVTSWETLNYKTLKPEPNGLFCQKIFGPVVDFVCACGKKKLTTKKNLYCPKCGVAWRSSRIRRYRLGYIKLKYPIVHPLYASQRPSPLALCLTWPTKKFQSVLKTHEFCCIPRFSVSFRFPIQSYRIWKNCSSSSSNPQFGGNRGSSRQFLSWLAVEKQPRLFLKKEKIETNFLLGPSTRLLYGIGRFASWRDVDQLQEFLYYLWERNFSYEPIISYYSCFDRNHGFRKETLSYPEAFEIQTGGLAIQRILSFINPTDMVLVCRTNLWDATLKEDYLRHLLRYALTKKEVKVLVIKLGQIKQAQLRFTRQSELFSNFSRKRMRLAWMVLNYLPVLPPDLRPITSIGGDLVVSDINLLYRKVLTRNKRINPPLRSFSIFDPTLSGSWQSWCYNIRQLQEAVDELIKTGSTEQGKPVKSILDELKGKQGRFRQNMLGKRVDYSGRSVIVVGPQLQLHQCGLPKQMALQLFQPFVIQHLLEKKIVPTLTLAKSLIIQQKPIIWSLLTEILRDRPVLLNRAPTLHRLGIQAFLPHLVEGKAILLHPLVCPAFNADFDGDQMAVHVPLSPQAQAEALTLLWSRNHVLAPASGQPLLLPTQDMVLGFYYLTCSKEKTIQEMDRLIPSRKALVGNFSLTKRKHSFYFSTVVQVKQAYDRGVLTLHSSIWLKWSGFVETLTPFSTAQLKENLLESRLDLSGCGESIGLDTCELWTKKTSQKFFNQKPQFIRTTVGRVLMHSWVFQTQG
jgi:DNA-directed RNA polymerase subunit beta'